MARNTQDTQAPQADAPEVPAFRWVVIQRPYGETQSHVFVGHNSFERQIQYDTPVRLPAVVVDHLRSLRIVEYRADATGSPVPTYANQFSVVDVPEPAAQ
jgi:hypothetical protein